jgi:hypothetical protein
MSIESIREKLARLDAGDWRDGSKQRPAEPAFTAAEMREVLAALEVTVEALAMLRAFVERKGSGEHLRQIGDSLAEQVDELLAESKIELG